MTALYPKDELPGADNSGKRFLKRRGTVHDVRSSDSYSEFLERVSRAAPITEACVAVDDLSLTVPQGGLFGFLGPNGAGKTTTIKMSARLYSAHPRRGMAIRPTRLGRRCAATDRLSAGTALLPQISVRHRSHPCPRRSIGSRWTQGERPRRRMPSHGQQCLITVSCRFPNARKAWCSASGWLPP